MLIIFWVCWANSMNAMECMVKWTWSKEPTISMHSKRKRTRYFLLSQMSQPEVLIFLQLSMSSSMIILQTIKFSSIEVVELQEPNNKVTPSHSSLSKKSHTWLSFQHMFPRNLQMIQVLKIVSIMVLCPTIFSLRIQTLHNNWNKRTHKFQIIRLWLLRLFRNLKNVVHKLHSTVWRRLRVWKFSCIIFSRTALKKSKLNFCKRSEISTQRNHSLSSKGSPKKENHKTTTF